MNKIFNKIAYGFGMLALTVMTFVSGSAAHAAVDSDFATATAALKQDITDNKGQWILWIAGVIGLYLLIRVAFKGLNFGANKALSAIPGGGGKGKRR